MFSKICIGIVETIRSCLNLFSWRNITSSFLVILFSLPVFSVNAAVQNSELNGNTIARAEFGAGLDAESLIQVFIALILVILVIFALSFVLKKFNMLPGGSSGFIKIIDGISLGSKDRLLLIQVGDEQILISASPGCVNKVHKLTAAIESEIISAAEKPERSGFSSMLDLLISRPRS